MISRRKFNKACIAIGAILGSSSSGALAETKPMIKRTIPSTGEQIPVIGLGTNRYSADSSAAARAPLKAALNRFHELGGTVIDTAPMYRSESVLGDLIAELGIRDDLFIATKTDKRDGADETQAQMQESSVKLKTDSFDLMQVHSLRGWETALPIIREWKTAGRVRYVGMTTSRENQYADFEQIIKTEELDFIQVNYSLEQRTAAKRLLPLAADKGIAVIINRGFGGGRLFGKLRNTPLPEWTKDFDCTSWAQFLLKYTISHPAATVVIPGMTKVHHVEDNMMAGHGQLPSEATRQKMELFLDSI